MIIFRNKQINENIAVITHPGHPNRLSEINNIELFLKQSKIVINNYEIDSNQRVITRNKIKVKLTEKELELILVLNKNNGLEKSFLLKNIWNRSSDLESHAFESHLHRLRKKINKFFKDKEFIVEKNSLYYLSK
jgi:DNA-binding response OmpR family regulator